LREDFFELGAMYAYSSILAQYYLQQNGRELKPPVSSEEFKKLFGIHAIIGCIKYPRIHMYWSKICKANKLWKLQPMIHLIRDKCRSIH
jgi:hypothetical protein